MSKGRKLLVLAVLVFAGMQVVPVDRSAPDDHEPLSIDDVVVADVMERACVDCHTNHTTWPWYSRVAPVSWWVVDHVQEGRSELNLSRWGELDARRRDHKLEELIELVEDGEMPLSSYTWGHPDARLTEAEREALIQWARSVRSRIGVSTAAGNAAPGKSLDAQRGSEHRADGG
jgi:hypothetical protein